MSVAAPLGARCGQALPEDARGRVFASARTRPIRTASPIATVCPGAISYRSSYEGRDSRGRSPMVLQVRGAVLLEREERSFWIDGDRSRTEPVSGADLVLTDHRDAGELLVRPPGSAARMPGWVDEDSDMPRVRSAGRWCTPPSTKPRPPRVGADGSPYRGGAGRACCRRPDGSGLPDR